MDGTCLATHRKFAPALPRAEGTSLQSWIAGPASRGHRSAPWFSSTAVLD